MSVWVWTQINDMKNQTDFKLMVKRVVSPSIFISAFLLLCDGTGQCETLGWGAERRMAYEFPLESKNAKSEHMIGVSWRKGPVGNREITMGVTTEEAGVVYSWFKLLCSLWDTCHSWWEGNE